MSLSILPLLKSLPMYPQPNHKEPRLPSKTEELMLRMLAGGLFGVCVDSVTNVPLVLQTRKFASDAAKIPSIGIFKAAHRLITKEGIRGCYSGFPIVAVGSLLGTGGYCVGSHLTRECLGNVTRECLGNDYLANLAAGYGGQISGSLLAWTKASVISEIQQAPKAIKAPKFHNKGAVEIGSLIVKEHGVSGLYRGFGVQLFNFGTINGLGELFAGMLRKKISRHEEASDLSLSQKLAINASSWGVASGLTTPFGVFKLRVQLSGMSPEHFPDSSSLQCAQRVWRNEGVRGLYAGATARVCAITPRAALFFTGMPYAYDALLGQLNLKTG